MAQTGAVKRTVVKTAPIKSRVEIPTVKMSSADAEFLRKVQEKAYELYLARGCAHGNDVEDWVAAEKIVRGA